MGDCAAHSTGFEGGAADRAGVALSGLHRLEYKGWIKAEWGASDNNRKAKFYSLTRTGKKQLEVELENWGRISHRDRPGARVGGFSMPEAMADAPPLSANSQASS